ncbi:hypothetical protein AALC17_04295 [Oscillospiraceae bacterium 38-13]
MAVNLEMLVAQLLSEYEKVTGEKIFKIAGDMDIPISNYYLYRNGTGNPTVRTINKIIEVIQLNHPEIIIKVGLGYLQRFDLEQNGSDAGPQC